MKIRKRYIKIGVIFTEDGTMVPKVIFWDSDKKFRIDKVLDVSPAASLKAGGQGDRYHCRINGYDHYIFFEDPAWFVEEKVFDS